MDASEYQKLVGRTWIDEPDFQITDKQVMVLWATVGLAGESGELLDLIKKGIFHQHGLDVPKIKGELGDICWYIGATCRVFGLDLSDVMQANIDKLKVRYPNGYNPADSQHRADLVQAAGN